MTTTTLDTQLDPAAVLAAYLEPWNTTDPAARLDLLRRTWAADATYVDPLADLTGPEAVSAFIGQVQERFAGMRFTPVGDADGHHRQVRFRWGLGPDGAEPLVIGFDVVTLDEAGAVRDVRGFLDRVPA